MTRLSSSIKSITNWIRCAVSYDKFAVGHSCGRFAIGYDRFAVGCMTDSLLWMVHCYLCKVCCLLRQVATSYDRLLLVTIGCYCSCSMAPCEQAGYWACVLLLNSMTSACMNFALSCYISEITEIFCVSPEQSKAQLCFDWSINVVPYTLLISRPWFSVKKVLCWAFWTIH